MAFDPHGKTNTTSQSSKKLTLDAWLETNGYTFLKDSLSQHLGIVALSDFSILSARDIRDFFEALKEANDPVLDKLNLKQRIEFKKKILQFGKHSNYQNLDSSSSAAIASSTTNSELALKLAPLQSLLNKLDKNCAASLVYLNKFQSDCSKLERDYNQCNQVIQSEYETLLYHIQRRQNELKHTANEEYRKQCLYLRAQIKALENHLEKSNLIKDKWQLKISQIVSNNNNNNTKLTKRSQDDIKQLELEISDGWRELTNVLDGSPKIQQLNCQLKMQQQANCRRIRRGNDKGNIIDSLFSGISYTAINDQSLASATANGISLNPFASEGKEEENGENDDVSKITVNAVVGGVTKEKEGDGDLNDTNDELTQLINNPSRLAMTWILKKKHGIYSCVGTDHREGSKTNAYNGDTPCTTILPILAINKSEKIAKPTDFDLGRKRYYEWSYGKVKLTPPIMGAKLVSLEVANKWIENKLGNGWRMAEFHDAWGWNFWAQGDIQDKQRFWVHINDQLANPWS